MMVIIHLAADAAANTLSAAAIERTPTAFQPSFDGDAGLFLWNLFVMTAGFFLGAMLVGRQAGRIFRRHRIDEPLAPVSLYRWITLFAGLALTIFCGAEAISLWGWNPNDPQASARAMMAKRWLDLVGWSAGLVCIGIVLAAEPGIEHQLVQPPLPTDEQKWSGWPVLARAALVTALCFAAAIVGVVLR